MKKVAARIALVAAALLMTAAAWAAPDVEIKVKAEKEKIVTKDGQKVKRLVPAKSFSPGEVIDYTILYRNKGNEPATGVVLNDPIPKGCVYIPGSASENGEVAFSIDGGKTYKKQSLLTYEVRLPNGTVEKRTASPEDYTNIRWTINSIAPGENGKVHFQVRVK